ncbi:hypothetical protein SLA2020_137940 [Shorea laevis]
MAKSAADSCSDTAAVQATNDDATASKLIQRSRQAGFAALPNAALYPLLPVFSESSFLRNERLELFDDFEEWHMMQEYHSVAYATNDAMLCLYVGLILNLSMVQGLFVEFGFPDDQQHALSPSLAALP